MLSDADLLVRVSQFLQDTALATYDATELGYWIREELKRLAQFAPVLSLAVYQVESRTGVETAGTALKLTDSTKSQFLSTDDNNEKVVHNTTDNTWAVVKGYTSTSILTISSSIMAAGEDYEIYNKRCINKKQIYIGDIQPFLWIDSVEYPIGTERNFIMVSRDILELDVEDSVIEDSNSTLSPLNNVDVLVRYALPHVLSQLTDWSGELTAGATAGATTIAIDGMGAIETIKAGELFTLEGHRTIYVVTTDVTMVAGAGNLIFFPGLEADAANNDDITFVKSTLLPSHEELLERMVSSRAVQSDSIRHINSVPIGGPNTMNKYQQWINNNPLLNPQLIQRELEALARPRPGKRCPRT